MTGQPERLHHLLDRLLRGVLLSEEAEQLAGAVRILQARVNDQDEAANVAVNAVRLMNQAGAQRDRAEARVRDLEAERTNFLAILTEAVDWIRDGDLRDRMLDAITPPRPAALCGCGRPDPGPCQPCPDNTPSLHCPCDCTPTPGTG